MTPKRETQNAQVPTLSPLYGGPDKKPRFLDKDVVSVGRARGCDITLDANEVSAIHCIFYRAPTGYRVRDCGSRTGTRLNGTAVKNSLMADGDVLQIGPFSFEVRLPVVYPGEQKIDPQQWERAHHSRRNLVRLALRLRRKLRQSPNGAHGLNDKAADLKAKIRGYDQRSQQLEQAEMELLEERAQIEKDKEAHCSHVQQVETDLARRLRETEDAVRAQWTEFQKRCAAEEARLQELSSAAASQDTGAAGAADASNDQARQHELSEREQKIKEREAAWERKEQDLHQVETDLARRLQETEATLRAQQEEFQTRCAAEEARLQELSATAAGQAADASKDEARQRELAEREQKLKQREAAWERREQDLQRDCEEVDRERQEVIKIKSQAEAEQRQKQTELDRQRAAVEQNEGKLRDQKTELTRMLTDLKRIQEELKKQPRVDVKPLQQENLQLRQQIAELEKQAAQASDAGQFDGQLKALRVENDELRRLLQDQLLKPAAKSGNDEALRKENEELRQILTEYEERLAAEIAAGVSSASSASNVSNMSGVSDAQVREENELLRQLLQEKDKILDEIRVGAAPATAEPPPDVREQMEAQANEVERLKTEVAKLEQQVQEQSKQQPAAPSAPAPENVDLDSYEAELNRYRQQLEADRAKLNQEIETLRARNSELDEATRDLEMELSRERAEMARERMRLDRLRDEIKAEMERLQRDGGVRESLASFQRLRDEVRATGGRR